MFVVGSIGCGVPLARRTGTNSRPRAISYLVAQSNLALPGDAIRPSAIRKDFGGR